MPILIGIPRGRPFIRHLPNPVDLNYFLLFSQIAFCCLLVGPPKILPFPSSFFSPPLNLLFTSPPYSFSLHSSLLFTLTGSSSSSSCCSSFSAPFFPLPLLHILPSSSFLPPHTSFHLFCSSSPFSSFLCFFFILLPYPSHHPPSFSSISSSSYILCCCSVFIFFLFFLPPSSSFLLLFIILPPSLPHPSFLFFLFSLHHPSSSSFFFHFLFPLPFFH